MSDAAETKPDPTTQAPEEQKPETATTGEGEKTVTEVAADKAKEAADTAKDAASKTSDTVFSMFGGGPKKEKKEETEEGADEPSGSSKAQKESEVSLFHVRHDGDAGLYLRRVWCDQHIAGAGVVFLVPAYIVWSHNSQPIAHPHHSPWHLEMTLCRLLTSHVF